MSKYLGFYASFRTNVFLNPNRNTSESATGPQIKTTSWTSQSLNKIYLGTEVISMLSYATFNNVRLVSQPLLRNFPVFVNALWKVTTLNFQFLKNADFETMEIEMLLPRHPQNQLGFVNLCYHCHDLFSCGHYVHPAEFQSLWQRKTFRGPGSPRWKSVSLVVIIIAILQ